MKKLTAALAVGLTMIAASAFGAAHATVITSNDPGFLAGFSTIPSDWTLAIYSDQANVDVGSQNPANVETVIESNEWLSMDVTFVGGGACGAGLFQNNCSAAESNKSGVSNLSAQIYAVHFGNKFLVFIFDSTINGFSIEDLPNGVSNIYAFNIVGVPEVPLPAAIWLMSAGIAGLGFAGRWKKLA